LKKRAKICFSDKILNKFLTIDIKY
jgi:hypothetical protein